MMFSRNCKQDIETMGIEKPHPMKSLFMSVWGVSFHDGCTGWISAMTAGEDAHPYLQNSSGPSTERSGSPRRTCICKIKTDFWTRVNLEHVLFFVLGPLYARAVSCRLCLKQSQLLRHNSLI